MRRGEEFVSAASSGMAAARLQRLPSRAAGGGLHIADARSFGSRLLGLALMRELGEHEALLIPRCSSVHTLGMRFAIDVVFLDAGERVLEVRHHLPPWRVARRRGAAAVLETRAGESWRFVRAGSLVR